MAITFVSATSSSNLVGTKPTGVLSGDVCVALVSSYEDTTTVITGPAEGWTLQHRADWDGFITSAVFTRVMTGSDVTNPTWTSSSAISPQVLIAAYRGVDNTTPWDTTATDNAADLNSSPTGLSITTATDGALLLYLITMDGSSGTGLTSVPSGFSSIRAGGTGEGGATNATAICDATQTTAGASGNKVGTSGVDYWIVTMGALRPAGGGGGGVTPVVIENAPMRRAQSQRFMVAQDVIGPLVAAPSLTSWMQDPPPPVVKPSARRLFEQPLPAVLAVAVSPVAPDEARLSPRRRPQPVVVAEAPPPLIFKSTPDTWQAPPVPAPTRRQVLNQTVTEVPPPAFKWAPIDPPAPAKRTALAKLDVQTPIVTPIAVTATAWAPDMSQSAPPKLPAQRRQDDVVPPQVFPWTAPSDVMRRSATPVRMADQQLPLVSTVQPWAPDAPQQQIAKAKMPAAIADVAPPLVFTYAPPTDPLRWTPGPQRIAPWLDVPPPPMFGWPPSTDWLAPRRPAARPADASAVVVSGPAWAPDATALQPRKPILRIQDTGAVLPAALASTSLAWAAETPPVAPRRPGPRQPVESPLPAALALTFFPWAAAEGIQLRRPNAAPRQATQDVPTALVVSSALSWAPESAPLRPARCAPPRLACDVPPPIVYPWTPDAAQAIVAPKRARVDVGGQPIAVAPAWTSDAPVARQVPARKAIQDGGPALSSLPTGMVPDAILCAPRHPAVRCPVDTAPPPPVGLVAMQFVCDPPRPANARPRFLTDAPLPALPSPSLFGWVPDSAPLFRYRQVRFFALADSGGVVVGVVERPGDVTVTFVRRATASVDFTPRATVALSFTARATCTLRLIPMTANATEYDVGDETTVQATFKDLAGNLANPTVATLMIRDPHGAETILRYPATGMTNPSVGVFEYVLLLSASGPWKARGVGQGAIVCASPDTIVSVSKTSFSNPIPA